MGQKAMTNMEFTDSVHPLLALYCASFLALLTIYLISSTVIQYWRLRSIPGPPVAAWTNLWLMYHMNSKERFYLVKKRLHQKYGPIVRYGPNRVMFGDLSAVSTILGTSNIYAKVTAPI
jgi:hypothetical protein